MTFLSIFFAINISNVYADETGPVVVQAIVQENYTQEITVLLVKPDTEEVVKTLKINKDNNWVQETNVPIGEYKMRVYGEGLVARSITQLKATYMVKKVIKNPSVHEKPCFVVIEGDKKFRELYTSLHQSQDVVLQQYRKKTISVWKSSFHYFNSSYSNSLLSSSFS